MLGNGIIRRAGINDRMPRPLGAPAHLYDWHFSTSCEYFALPGLICSPFHCPLAPIMRPRTSHLKYSVRLTFSVLLGLHWYRCRVMHGCLRGLTERHYNRSLCIYRRFTAKNQICEQVVWQRSSYFCESAPGNASTSKCELEGAQRSRRSLTVELHTALPQMCTLFLSKQINNMRPQRDEGMSERTFGCQKPEE